MPPTLPTELIAYIAKLAAPLSYSPLSHAVRQRTLLNCCLASSVLRAIAQPLLAEVFFVRTHQGAKKAVEVDQSGLFGSRVRVLVAFDVKALQWSQQLDDWGAWLGLPAVCSNVTDLQLVAMSDVDLSFFCLFRQLKTLHIDDSPISVGGHMCFPLLREASLSQIKTRLDVLHTFLDARSTPALETLSIHAVKTSGLLVDLSAVLHADLLIRLKAVGLKLKADKAPHNAVSSPLCPILTCCSVPLSELLKDCTVVRALPEHIRLEHPDTHSFDPLSFYYARSRRDSLYSDLSTVKLLFNLPCASPPFRSLHLPLTLHPAWRVERSLRLLCDEVVELCEREGVRVFWYSRATAHAFRMTDGFVKWLDEEAARRSEEEARRRARVD
ncbi:hypothetical protein JCM10207_000777 [Rhodosporidiobolus poonsookiae]